MVSISNSWLSGFISLSLALSRSLSLSVGPGVRTLHLASSSTHVERGAGSRVLNCVWSLGSGSRVDGHLSLSLSFFLSLSLSLAFLALALSLSLPLFTRAHTLSLALYLSDGASHTGDGPLRGSDGGAAAAKGGLGVGALLCPDLSEGALPRQFRVNFGMAFFLKCCGCGAVLACDVAW